MQHVCMCPCMGKKGVNKWCHIACLFILIPHSHHAAHGHRKQEQKHAICSVTNTKYSFVVELIFTYLSETPGTITVCDSSYSQRRLRYNKKKKRNAGGGGNYHPGKHTLVTHEIKKQSH